MCDYNKYFAMVVECKERNRIRQEQLKIEEEEKKRIECLEIVKKPRVSESRRKWSHPLKIITPLLQFLKTQHKRDTVNAKTFFVYAKHDLFELPEECKHEFFDIRTNDMSVVTEVVKLESRSELTSGYRLVLPVELKVKPEDEIKVENDLIKSIHHVVTCFISDATLLLYKKNIFFGKLSFHFIYDKNVAIDMGSEIAEAATTAFREYPGNVTNIYKHKFIELQPVLANSITICPFCSYKTNFHCMTCNQVGYVESSNCFRLASVWNPDETKNLALFDMLLSDPRRQIQETSLFTISGPLKCKRIPVEFPQGPPPPKMSRKELSKILIEELSIENYMGVITKLKPKDLKPKKINITPPLQKFFHAWLSRKIAFLPEIEVYRIRNKPFDRVMRIKLIGEYSTYCPEKKQCISNNYTELWIVVRLNVNAYTRCSRCTKFHKFNVIPDSSDFRKELARFIPRT